MSSSLLRLSGAAYGGVRACRLPRTGSLLSQHARSLAQYSAEPYRKSVKDSTRQRKRHANSAELSESTTNPYGLDGKTIDQWELTVGIEIHAQLNTNRKLFSDARSATEETANSLAAVFDLSFPGSQPIFQRSVLLPALRAALALQCDVERRSTFDRKHYFYQDQPAGYQITQYYSPLARSGGIELFDHDGIAPEDGKSIWVGIKQVQLEQDTAKSVQQPPDQVLLDFNRVGHPLVEIISLPHIHHPKTAAAYVRKVSQLLLSVDAVTTGMELGGLRADVNVSVRRKDAVPGLHSYSGVSGLGQRTEIKNLSSFKAVEEAIIAERNRQIDILRRGGQIEGETRGWTLGSTETVRLRGKEGEVDYRYMPDPDIPPLLVSSDLVQHLARSMPTLPDAQLQDLTQNWGVGAKDSKTLIALDDGRRMQYFHDVIAELQRMTNLNGNIAGKMAANWVLHELGGLFSLAEEEFDAARVSPSQLASILKVLQEDTVSGKTAKQLLSMFFDGDVREVQTMIDEDNLALQRMSANEYECIARQLVEEHPEQAEKARSGQKGKVQFFIGQMMRESQGTLDAQQARLAIQSVLDGAPSNS